ncbi:hypothetical protein C2W62_40310 [Candidatus Entotheonella serta]|nr:hypothetical protein C2W62_40310 [Candidatus Entotheonella serta]
MSETHANRSLAQSQATKAEADVDPDVLLARLDQLESLLRADLARKAKFQKPAKQQQWQAEIDRLWRQLEG